MRIISGTAKGKKISNPINKKTRPLNTTFTPIEARISPEFT